LGDLRERIVIERGAEARGELEEVQRGRGEPLEPRRHERGHVVGDGPRRDRGEIPPPRPALLVEGDEFVLRQRRQELADEEGVSLGLLVDLPAQRGDLARRRAQRVRDELARVHRLEGAERDVRYLPRGLGDALERAREDIYLRRILVAVRPDDEQVAR